MHQEIYTTEYDVEKKFIEVIKTNWYSYNPISSYEDLVLNFRDKINKLNKDILKTVSLTDEEFNEILIYLEKQSIFEASQILRSGKIDIVKREGYPLYLKLVDINDIEKNCFEVVHQIKTEGTYVGRFDVTLLINGLPFIQIELKKPGVEINQAFHQVLRYKRDGNYNGLFNFIQLFVMSNEQHTKYFANNDHLILKSNCFVWTNENNEVINSLYDFEENFLFCPFLFKIVFEYMIDSAYQKRLYVMRPYQIYAFEALRTRCLIQSENGYCFHSTGSGKTLTSFKFAYAMSLKPDVDKVFFLVDRKDLDDKTVEDFNSYMSSSVEEFNNVDKTSSLIKDIKSNTKFMITTINKMSNALKNKRYLNDLKELKNKKIIFMFDECHRSQAGKMRQLIQNFFDNALYYGFTGTPIFTEEDEITENTKLTSLYFGKPVHTYTLKEAIGDKNVLPLCIDYVEPIKTDNSQIKNFDLISDKRCELVANDVIDHYEQKTFNKRYNAIFACQSISLLLKYYNLLLKNKLKLKIAAIYSFNPNEDCKEGDKTEIAKNELAKIIKEYNKRPENNSNFALATYAQYERDVIQNFRNKTLDLLLVVDKCLTGMDFKKCNTLYLDKSMKMHGLIQAISRTIRTEDESKICGNIVCYQTTRKMMDDALAHFNNDIDVYNEVTLLPLEELIKKLNEAFLNCKDLKKLASSKSEKDKLKFVNSFRELMHIYNQINNYLSFDINKTKMDMKTYYELQGLYKDIYNEIKPNINKESVLNDIDFEISLLEKIKVNFDYLVDLLIKYHEEHQDKQKISKRINKIILEIKDKEKQKLIQKFVIFFMEKDNKKLYRSPIKEYEEFIKNEKNNELKKISEKYSIKQDNLKVLIENYSFFRDEQELSHEITKLFSNSFLNLDDKLVVFENLPIDIKKYFDKFDEITIY